MYQVLPAYLRDAVVVAYVMRADTESRLFLMHPLPFGVRMVRGGGTFCFSEYSNSESIQVDRKRWRGGQGEARASKIGVAGDAVVIRESLRHTVGEGAETRPGIVATAKGGHGRGTRVEMLARRIHRRGGGGGAEKIFRRALRGACIGLFSVAWRGSQC